MIFLEDNIWFSPLNVVYYFRKLECKLSNKEKLSKGFRDGFRKAEEMFSVAIMLIGIMKLQRREYWLQMVDDKFGSPDVRTGTFRKLQGVKMPEFTIQDVEVVNYDNYSSKESLSEFLKRTKLSKITKSYDSKTTILCRIKLGTHSFAPDKLNKELKACTFLGSVMILISTSPNQKNHVYKIAQIYPIVELVSEFDVLEELKNKKHKGVLKLKRGTTLYSEYIADGKHFPFEKINFTK